MNHHKIKVYNELVWSWGHAQRWWRLIGSTQHSASSEPTTYKIAMAGQRLRLCHKLHRHKIIMTQAEENERWENLGSGRTGW